HRVAELLRRGPATVVGAEIGVVRLVAVSSPVTLHLAGVGIDHRDALVAIAVGDISLVGFCIDPDLRRPAEVLRIVAAAVRAEMADLQQELAVLGELEDLRVLLAVAADPYVTLVVDVDAMIRLRPLVARSRTAPRTHQIALRIEDQYRRSRAAAFGDRRVELGAPLVVVQPARTAMNDPDVVLLVDPDAD